MNAADRNEAVCSPPRPLPLGGRVFLLSPPTLEDNAAIVAEGRRLLAAQETPLGLLVNDPAFARLPPACQVECAREAARVQASGRQELSGLDLAEELGRPKLLGFAVWLLARGNHDGLTLEEVRPLVTEDNAGAVFADFCRASGILGLPKN